MSIYGKIIVLGIIGLIIVGIILGVSTAPPPGIDLSMDAAMIDMGLGDGILKYL